jgi:hypothetical protein
MTTDILDAMYQVPVNGPFDERYFHEDIKNMSAFEIQREYDQAHHRLLMEQRPHHWLLERMVRLQEEFDNAVLNSTKSFGNDSSDEIQTEAKTST